MKKTLLTLIVLLATSIISVGKPYNRSSVGFGGGVSYKNIIITPYVGLGDEFKTSNIHFDAGYGFGLSATVNALDLAFNYNKMNGRYQNFPYCENEYITLNGYGQAFSICLGLNVVRSKYVSWAIGAGYQFLLCEFKSNNCTMRCYNHSPIIYTKLTLWVGPVGIFLKPSTSECFAGIEISFD